MCLDVHKIPVWKPVPIPRKLCAHLFPPPHNTELPPLELAEITPALTPSLISPLFSTRLFLEQTPTTGDSIGRRRDLDARDLDGDEGKSSALPHVSVLLFLSLQWRPFCDLGFCEQTETLVPYCAPPAVASVTVHRCRSLRQRSPTAPSADAL
ncbi:hypothetical protein GUJ93_ZPchr0012g18980 [Zizania palustris]|uniref:Uncharacterized protein n=1 Tax=Zizania palustris TaxID=103762 RepID=A0A8J6BNL6_ZIZPA|nr:hypothetical protein GUJ93_ZPchr0012g18980 [Zizania palustris]